MPLGAIITISDKNIGTGLCRILEKKHDVLDNVREYVAESIGAYSPAEKKQAEIESEKKPPADGKDGASAAYPIDYKDFTRFIFNDLKQRLVNPPIQPTSPTNQVHDLSLSFTANADKTITVIIKFKYTQGLYRANQFLLYQNTATTVPPAIDTATSSCRTIAVDQNAPDNHEYTAQINLPQVSGNVQLHYRFAITAAFLGTGSLALHKDGVIDGGESWRDVTVEQPPAGSLYNYWSYDTGELRAGEKDNYIKLDPAAGKLNLEGIKIPQVEQDINRATLTLDEKIKQIDKKLDENMIKLFSHGYIQWPGEPAPNTIYSFDGYEWEKIDYDGCFFRAEGKDALPFDGGEQGDAIRNITGVFEAYRFAGDLVEHNPSALFGERAPVATTYPQYAESGRNNRLRFDASRVVPTADENRPRNRTFIIWRLKKL